MVHQYIYIVNENTDEFGWQYRSQWSALGPPGPKDEPWVNSYQKNSIVRRRIWMTTIVPRQELTRAKRLLSENVRSDNGIVKLQGELLRYEKGSLLSKPWQKRQVVLLHNRLEIYTNQNKKVDIPLAECEVKMLFEQQAPTGAKCAFSVRNPSGSVGVIFDAEDKGTRRAWVFAIQYQLAMNSHEMNFIPLEYSPPTGSYPDNRVLIAGEMKLQGKDSSEAYQRNFHLRPRELIYFDGEELRGRIFVEQASVAGEERSLAFAITSKSGITLNLTAENAEAKNLWLIGIRRQVQSIENYKMKAQTAPREELDDSGIPVIDRISQFYDEGWTAPAVAGEDEDYLKNIFTAPYQDNPAHFEFSEELEINLDPNSYKAPRVQSIETVSAAPLTHKASKIDINVSDVVIPHVMEVKELTLEEYKAMRESRRLSTSEMSAVTTTTITTEMIEAKKTEKFETQSAISEDQSQMRRMPLRTSSILKSTRSIQSAYNPSTKLLDPKRILINPRFMLSALRGVTHRFVIVMECENRINAPKDIQDAAPPRFSVGGPRASKDPKTVPLNQLIGISNKKPEVKLPAGWFMLHQYVYIVQQNTDDEGWQYRSTWSEGTPGAGDEQWVDTYNESKYVRRRMWMTTVVRKDEMWRGKKMAFEELNRASGDAILQETLYLYNPELASTSSSWQRRKVLLYHNKLEFYSGNDKTGEANLADCEVTFPTGKEKMGREFPFRITHPTGSVQVLLDADSASMRLRWVRAIVYQLAVITPDLSFDPFIFGPPTGELVQTRILLVGDLSLLDNQGTWTSYQFHLQERALLCYSQDKLKGRLLLDQALLKARDDESEFTIKTSNGLIVHLKAASPEIKFAWIRSLKRQVQALEYHRLKINSFDEATPAYRTVLKNYYDLDWIAREEEYREDDDFVQAMRIAYESDFVQFWPDECGTMKEISERKSSKDLPNDETPTSPFAQQLRRSITPNSRGSGTPPVSRIRDLAQYSENESETTEVVQTSRVTKTVVNNSVRSSLSSNAATNRNNPPPIASMQYAGAQGIPDTTSTLSTDSGSRAITTSVTMSEFKSETRKESRTGPGFAQEYKFESTMKNESSRQQVETADGTSVVEETKSESKTLESKSVSSGQGDPAWLASRALPLPPRLQRIGSNDSNSVASMVKTDNNSVDTSNAQGRSKAASSPSLGGKGDSYKALPLPPKLQGNQSRSGTPAPDSPGMLDSDNQSVASHQQPPREGRSIKSLSSTHDLLNKMNEALTTPPISPSGKAPPNMFSDSNDEKDGRATNNDSGFDSDRSIQPADPGTPSVKTTSSMPTSPVPASPSSKSGNTPVQTLEELKKRNQKDRSFHEKLQKFEETNQQIAREAMEMQTRSTLSSSGNSSAKANPANFSSRNPIAIIKAGDISRKNSESSIGSGSGKGSLSSRTSRSSGHK